MIPTANGRPRRSICVVLDGPPTPAWQARSLAELSALPALDLAAVRLVRGPVPRAAAQWLEALERRLLRAAPDALAPTHVRAREGPPEAADAEVSAGALVVWLADGDRPDAGTGELVELRHGGGSEPASDVFARAVITGIPCIESELVWRSGGEEIVVERTVSAVRQFSLGSSRDLALWKMATLVRRGVERLVAGEGPALTGAATATRPAGLEAPPSPGALARHALRAWSRVLVTRLLYRRPWSIRVRPRGANPAGDWSKSANLLQLEPGHVYADPCLIEHAGRHHLFCEELVHGGRRRGRRLHGGRRRAPQPGVISHTELPTDGTIARAPVPVLERPYHLSYPLVFAHGDDLLMIPETSAVRRVELYRAIEFPHRWELVTTVLDGIDAADATILDHDGRLWMFVSVAAEHASSLDELHLYWAHAPAGPWHPHVCNPVVSDVRCARPAGAIQRWDGRLIRPAQDGSRRYGGAISFRGIDVLSVSAYAEHEVDRLEAADVGHGARATHTYSSDGRFEAIDLRRRELRWGRLAIRP